MGDDLTGTLTQRYSYTLDATGKRKQIAENNRVSSYSYDNLYRLVQEQITDSVNGNYFATYQYDAVGNRVYSTISGVSTAYSYDDNDRLLQQGGTTYTYDANGNTLSKNAAGQVSQYTYNSQDKLIAVQQGADSIFYQYNANGIRSQKTQAGSTTKYIVDENRDYAQVLVEENPLQRVVYSYGDDLISQNRNGNVAFYEYDGLGSTRRLTNAAGVVTDAYDYEAFGETLNKTGSTANVYLFTGEQFDSSLNQYYLRARYYDQGSGRFSQMDSYQGNGSDPLTLHKYLYANGNPVSFTDPSGNSSMGEMGATMNVQGTLSSTTRVFYTGIKRVIYQKTVKIYSVLTTTKYIVIPHAFMYVEKISFPKRLRYDVGPEEPMDAIISPSKSFPGGITESKSPNIPIKLKVAYITELGFKIWRAYVLSLPASCEYSLLSGPNCISWTLNASFFAKSIEYSEKALK